MQLLIELEGAIKDLRVRKDSIGIQFLVQYKPEQQCIIEIFFFLN